MNDFVANGGHVVYTFRSGFTDENVKVHPIRQPAPFREQVGASYQQFTSIDKMPLKSTKLKTQGADLAFDSWIELMIPEGAEVWATYDSPYWGQYAAITHHKSGRGAVTYIAGNPTPALTRELLQTACAEAGITPSARQRGISRHRSQRNKRARTKRTLSAQLFRRAGHMHLSIQVRPRSADRKTYRCRGTGGNPGLGSIYRGRIIEKTTNMRLLLCLLALWPLTSRAADIDLSGDWNFRIELP